MNIFLQTYLVHPNSILRQGICDGFLQSFKSPVKYTKSTGSQCGGHHRHQESPKLHAGTQSLLDFKGYTARLDLSISFIHVILKV